MMLHYNWILSSKSLSCLSTLGSIVLQLPIFQIFVSASAMLYLLIFRSLYYLQLYKERGGPTLISMETKPSMVGSNTMDQAVDMDEPTPFKDVSLL